MIGHGLTFLKDKILDINLYIYITIISKWYTGIDRYQNISFSSLNQNGLRYGIDHFGFTWSEGVMFLHIFRGLVYAVKNWKKTKRKKKKKKKNHLESIPPTKFVPSPMSTMKHNTPKKEYLYWACIWGTVAWVPKKKN